MRSGKRGTCFSVLGEVCGVNGELMVRIEMEGRFILKMTARR